MRISKGFKVRSAKSAQKAQRIAPVPVPKTYADLRKLSGDQQKRFIKKQDSTAQSSPGKVKNSESYNDGTPGLFTQSVKGSKPTNFCEKALARTLEAYQTKE
jgi:hypothetical protein